MSQQSVPVGGQQVEIRVPSQLKVPFQDQGRVRAVCCISLVTSWVTRPLESEQVKKSGVNAKTAVQDAEPVSAVGLFVVSNVFLSSFVTTHFSLCSDRMLLSFRTIDSPGEVSFETIDSPRGRRCEFFPFRRHNPVMTQGSRMADV